MAFISDLDDKTLGGNFNGPRTGDGAVSGEARAAGQGRFCASFLSLRLPPGAFLFPQRRGKETRGGVRGRGSREIGRASGAGPSARGAGLAHRLRLAAGVKRGVPRAGATRTSPPLLVPGRPWRLSQSRPEATGRVQRPSGAAASRRAAEGSGQWVVCGRASPSSPPRSHDCACHPSPLSLRTAGAMVSGGPVAARPPATWTFSH